MSNKIIPLRRVSRRKRTKKMQQAHELSLQINATSNSTTAVMKLGGRIIHRSVDKFEPVTFPSGGIVLRDDIPSQQEFDQMLGWTPEDGKQYRQLIEAAIREASEEDCSDVQPPPIVWKEFTFTDKYGKPLKPWHP